jgi:hypothetical protein
MVALGSRFHGKRSTQTLASNSCRRVDSSPLKLIGLYGELEGGMANPFRCFSPPNEPWRSAAPSTKVGANHSPLCTVLQSPPALETTMVRILASRRPVGVKLVGNIPMEHRPTLTLASVRAVAMAAAVFCFTPSPPFARLSVYRASRDVQLRLERKHTSSFY